MAKFPDLTGDGKVTQADVLKGRGVYKKGGSVMSHDHGHKPTAKMSHGGHYCWGGKVMKKAKGGVANMIQRQMQSAQQKAGKPAGIAALSSSKMQKLPVQKSTASSSAQNAYNQAQAQKTYDQMQAQKSGQYSSKPQMAVMKKAEGGMAKGGNWIQGAIKKPGALHKALGVPEGKKIPAAKLEKASQAPGKMGRRARLAMTLKGMK